MLGSSKSIGFLRHLILDFFRFCVRFCVFPLNFGTDPDHDTVMLSPVAPLICAVCNRSLRQDYYVLHTDHDNCLSKFHYDCIRRSMSTTYAILFPGKQAVQLSACSTMRGAKASLCTLLCPLLLAILLIYRYFTV